MRFIVAICAILSVSGAAAQSTATREMPITFNAGALSTEVSDVIAGYQSITYTLGLEAGRRLTVSLNPSNAATYFNIYGPGSGPGDEALANSGMTGDLVPDLNRFDQEVLVSGTYTISVYMMRSAARRNESSDFVLTVAMDDAGPVPGPVKADYADGLQGGPDYWQVRTPGNGALNLRDAPSTGAKLIGQFSPGESLRNLGCRMAEGRRWCSVETPDGRVSGWAAGDFLIEGAAPRTLVASEPETETVRVNFAPGTTKTTITDRVAEGAAINYILGASEGQTLNITLRPDGDFTHFNVVVPDGELLYESAEATNSYHGQLYLSGDHTVIVYYLGGNGSASIFDINLSIE